MEAVLGVLVVGVVIFLANRFVITGERDAWVRVPLYLIAGMTIYISLNLVFLGAFSLVQDGEQMLGEVGFTPLPIGPSLLVALISIIVGVFAILAIASLRMRERIRAFLVRVETLVYRKKSPLRYDPESLVHTTALVLGVVYLVYTLQTLMLLGGLEGLAETIANEGLSIQSILINAILFVLVALLGVGLFIRRNGEEVAERLALRLPIRQDWVWGIIGGGGAFALMFVGSLIWSLITPSESLEQQTIALNQFFEVYSDSFLIALVIAMTASVSEEILFRGALQPVFGVLTTSIYFVLLHSQYAFTPATFILLGVTLIFAFLRYRYSTTTAIIAHFIYNLLPYLLLLLFGSLTVAGS